MKSNRILILLLIIKSLKLMGSVSEDISPSTAPIWADILPLQELIKLQPDISYIKCRDSMRLTLPMFPIASSIESSWADPRIPKVFIFSVSNGRVFSRDGLVFSNHCLIKDLLWRWSYLRTSSFDLNILSEPEYVEGKTVVIAQEGSSNYYHWMVEVLPKLALLEENNIDYDRIFVSQFLPFMRQTLDLFGIKQEKIFEAQSNTYIEAQELIVPSAPALSCYTPKWIIEYLREKLMLKSEQVVSDLFFSKRVFVSRKKASYRRIINEDAVFGLFEKEGFVRYYLEDLTILEQVYLFHNAEIIVAPHGAGLVNLIFAEPHALIIELFQEHEDDTFCYLSQVR